MTILDAKSLLFTFFTSHHAFTLSDCKALIPISVTEELDKCIISSALEDMEKSELVRRLQVGGKSVWVLLQTLDNYSQNTSLGRATCTAIVSILNAAAEQFKNDEILPDPLNIREKDIQNILILLQNSLKK